MVWVWQEVWSMVVVSEWVWSVLVVSEWAWQEVWSSQVCCLLVSGCDRGCGLHRCAGCQWVGVAGGVVCTGMLDVSGCGRRCGLHRCAGCEWVWQEMWSAQVCWLWVSVAGDVVCTGVLDVSGCGRRCGLHRCAGCEWVWQEMWSAQVCWLWVGVVEDELQLFLQGTIELTNSILSVRGKIVAAHCDKEGSRFTIITCQKFNNCNNYWVW